MLKRYRGKIHVFFYKYSYEILLLSLLFHLYGSIFFKNIYFYGTYVRAANTVFVYVAATNSFFHKYNKLSSANTVLTGATLVLNLYLTYFNETIFLREFRELSVLVFFLLILYNTFVFILSPNRLDKSLISAAIAGYLSIIEVAVRFFMILYLTDGNHVLSSIDFSHHTKTFIDTVYYCTVTITSIGFGVILPLSHNAKMATSLLGLTGQFYLVIIMSIMVSKFVSGKNY